MGTVSVYISNLRDLQTIVEMAEKNDRTINTQNPLDLYSMIVSDLDDDDKPIFKNNLKELKTIADSNFFSRDLSILFQKLIETPENKTAQKMIEIIIPYTFLEFYSGDDEYLPQLLVNYHLKTNSDTFVKFLVDTIQNAVGENEVAQIKIFFDLAYDQDKDLFNKVVSQLATPKVYFSSTLKEILTKQGQLLDTSMAFRGSNLPPEIVENIINEAYDTRSTLGLYESMERIEPIINPTPGVTRAARHAAFKDANN